MKEIKTTSQLLFKDEPLVINRQAAKVLGLNEAIVVQQVHYWLDICRKSKINFHDGRTWTYNTYEAWQKDNFDFWNTRTVNRIFKNLFDKGILLKGNYNKHKYDRKLWVTIDYDKLDQLLNEYESKNAANIEDVKNVENAENVENSTLCQNVIMSNCNIMTKCHNGLCQNVIMDNDKMSSPIAETNTETSNEISITTQSENKSLVVEENENVKLIESNTHLLLDSKNKRTKASKWNKDRLLKAIEIFKAREGEYFSLLEKIYKDDKNFVPKSDKTGSNKAIATVVKTRFHNINETFRNYEPKELEQLIKETQKDKFRAAQEVQDDKYINDTNKTADNVDKCVINTFALSLIKDRCNIDIDSMTVNEIVEAAVSNGINLKLNELTNEYELYWK